MKKITDSMYKILYVFMTVVFVKLLLDILGRDFVPRTLGESAMRVLGWLIGIAACFGVYRLIKKTESIWEKYGTLVVCVFSVIFFVIQMVLGNELRVNPLYDFSSIYHGAVDWVVTGSFERFYDYYYYYPNNLGVMTLLMGLFQIAAKVGVMDFYFVGMLFNSLLSVGMIVATYCVCRKLFSASEAVFSVVLYALYPPMYLMAPVFYTDHLTMIFPVLLFLMYLCLNKSEGAVKTGVYSIAIALVSVVGYILKPTVLIMLVAVMITLFLARKWKKLLCVGVAFAIVYVCVNLAFDSYIYETHLNKETAAQMNTPIETWVMMGMNENPGFSPDDTEFSRSIADPEQRKEAVREEIAERVKNFGVTGILEHFKNKGILAFSDGTFELSYTFLFGFQKETDLADTVTLLGENYNRYWDACSSIWYVYLIFGVTFFVLMTFGCLKSGKIRFELLPIPLATFGLYCFLMLWEVHARYMVNFFSCFVLLAVWGMSLFDKITKKEYGDLAGRA